VTLCVIDQLGLFLCVIDQLGLFLSFLEVDDGSGTGATGTTADSLGTEMLPVTSFAIQIDTVRSNVLQFQHLIAIIAFEASSVILVVADHHFLGGIN